MRIPNSDLEVSTFSLGTGDLGTKLRGDESNRLIDAYAELGGNFLDSAHCYGFWVPGEEGASERAVGDWLRSSGARDRIVISTKGGHPPLDGYPHPDAFLGPEAIIADATESLERLGADRIDLYFLHRDDGATPVGEVIDALNAIESLRWFGASNWSIERVAEANAYARREGKRGFVALQNQWSLAVPCWQPTVDPTVRFITGEDLAWCVANEVAIHAYSSTANGYFSDDRDTGPFVGNVEIRARARQLGDRLGKTPNQVSLAWLLNQPGLVVPILGTTKIEHLRDAFGAAEIELNKDTLVWLRGG